MADLHTLPEPALPEGWECCGNGWWRRFGFRRKQLFVARDRQGSGRPPFRGYVGAVAPGRAIGNFASLAEAITEVEAAYCNARIRR